MKPTRDVGLGTPVVADEDQRLDWLRNRLWHLLVGTVIGVTPVLSLRYGPLLSLALVLIMYFPWPRSWSVLAFRWPSRPPQAGGR